MMKCKKPIAVLLATYNGSAYLAEQLNSLRLQDFREFEIFVHDDGSTDSTPDILREFQECFEGRLHILDPSVKGLGAKRNFLWLMEEVDAAYYMFCDQDDIWLPAKVGKSFAKLKEMENRWPHSPLLVQTDLTVVDGNQNVIAQSFWQYSGHEPDLMKRFGFCAVSNVFTGCTMMFNRAARDRSLPAHPEAPMHDWWVALITTKYGYADNIKEQLILYRQHGNNTLSAGGGDHIERSMDKLIHLMDKYRENRAMLKSLNYGYIKGFFFKFIYTIRRTFKKNSK